jgi:signal transduction histidine kinase
VGSIEHPDELTELVVLDLAPDGTVRRATGDLDVLLGRSSGEVQGHLVREVFADAVGRDIAGLAEQCARDGAVAGATVVLDGGRRCRVDVHPGADGALVVARDLTRIGRLRLETELLRRITELANAGAGTDAEDVADAAILDIATTAGWTAGRLVSRHGDARSTWIVADPRSATDALEEQLAVLPDSETTLSALQHAKPRTSRDHPDDPAAAAATAAGLHGMLAVPLVTDGEAVAVLEFLTSEPLHLDDRLRDLLRDVGLQLGSVFGRQRVLDDLRRSNTELERFAHVASHDLQEPLRKIVGFAELLADHHEPTDEDEETYLNYLVDAASRMQQLIRDLLRFSRAGRTSLEAVVVDLDDTIDQVLSDLEPLLGEQPVEIRRGHRLGAVLGDPGMLSEAVRNLVTNAVKYRDPERPLVLDISAQEGDSRRWLDLTISDNGIGIDPEHRDAVFDIFRRLHPRHVHPGTGVGLALVRRIVQRHGGSARIEDGPDSHGISVTLTLPRHEEDRA